MLNVKSDEKIFIGSGTLNKAEHNISGHLFYFKNLKKINKLALILLFCLNFIGVFNLLAVSGEHAIKQLIYLVLFSPVFLLIVALNPRYLLKFAYLGFFASLLILASIFVVGDISMGARRWIDFKLFKFQPSELAKIVTIIAIARYYHFSKETEIYKFKSAIIPLLIIFSQVALILKQPDLGTSLTITLIGVSVIFLAGLKIRYFLIAFLLGLIAIPIIWGKLHDYQRKRIQTFLNPDEDTLGSGYNIAQAKIAIGSGGLYGKGPFEGTQGSLEFLPESHTDFAFTVFAEQFGFLGSLVLILLYMALLYFGFSIAAKSESHFIRLMAGGITCLFFFHILINLAMTSGLIPVVGNPLPFISYGGTFLLSNLACFAILLNLDINKSIIIHSSKESYMAK